MRHKLVGHKAADSPGGSYAGRVRRLGGRAILLLGMYVAVILAVVVAGFLGAALGIWASVLWGVALIGGLVLYLRRRSRQPQARS
jgi:type IV secretory pathway TrbD component